MLPAEPCGCLPLQVLAPPGAMRLKLSCLSSLLQVVMSNCIGGNPKYQGTRAGQAGRRAGRQACYPGVLVASSHKSDKYMGESSMQSEGCSRWASRAATIRAGDRRAVPHTKRVGG